MFSHDQVGSSFVQFLVVAIGQCSTRSRLGHVLTQSRHSAARSPTLRPRNLIVSPPAYCALQSLRKAKQHSKKVCRNNNTTRSYHVFALVFTVLFIRSYALATGFRLEKVGLLVFFFCTIVHGCNLCPLVRTSSNDV